jgi:hypothetical protein
MMDTKGEAKRKADDKVLKLAWGGIFKHAEERENVFVIWEEFQRITRKHEFSFMPEYRNGDMFKRKNDMDIAYYNDKTSNLVPAPNHIGTYGEFAGMDFASYKPLDANIFNIIKEAPE